MHHEIPRRPNGALDRQAFINLAGRLVIEQGQPSSTPGAGCLYRGPNGRRCALGFFIPEDKVSEADGPYQVAQKLDLPYDSILSSIQAAHDDADEESFVEDFRERMSCVAKGHDLVFEPGV